MFSVSSVRFNGSYSTYVTTLKHRVQSTEHIVIKLNSCSLIARPHLHSPHWVLSDLMLSVNRIMVQYRAPCVLAAVLRSIIFYLFQGKYKQCTTNSTKCTYKWFHHSPQTQIPIYEIFYFIISFICSWAALFVVFIFLAGESLGPLTLSLFEFRFLGVYVNKME